jgi:hypothetical protein
MEATSSDRRDLGCVFEGAKDANEWTFVLPGNGSHIALDELSSGV